MAAAIALHALLLIWPLPAVRRMDVSNGLLHVDLLNASGLAVNQPAPKALPATTHTLAGQQKSQSAQSKKAPHKQKQPAIRADASAPQPKPASTPVLATESTAPNTAFTAFQDRRQPSQSSHAANIHPAGQPSRRPGKTARPASHLPASMAAGVQSMLLASIHYPAQARRHGWQGAGEFQIDINSQSIRKITMLVSTGHAILDRAAKRGLTSVVRVPVADGRYHLPVEFRLQ